NLPYTTLFRSKKRDDALSKAARFAQWVKSARGLEDLAESGDLAIAVAQHYGLPTNFIDFTTEPKSAAFLATDGWKESGSKEGVIICVNTQVLLDFWESMTTRYPLRACLPLSLDYILRTGAVQGCVVFFSEVTL